MAAAPVLKWTVQEVVEWVQENFSEDAAQCFRGKAHIYLHVCVKTPLGRERGLHAVCLYGSSELGVHVYIGVATLQNEVVSVRFALN